MECFQGNRWAVKANSEKETLLSIRCDTDHRINRVGLHIRRFGYSCQIIPEQSLSELISEGGESPHGFIERILQHIGINCFVQRHRQPEHGG